LKAGLALDGISLSSKPITQASGNSWVNSRPARVAGDIEDGAWLPNGRAIIAAEREFQQVMLKIEPVSLGSIFGKDIGAKA
jgi:hypothetical protein